LCFVISSLIAINAAISLWTDLKCYSKNKWDFKQDSGETAFYGYRVATTKMENAERVLH